jgi:hypothetical protein
MVDDTRVRIGHCSPDAPNVDVHVDGEPAFEDVAFGDVSDYASLAAGDHEIRVVPSDGGDAVIETDLTIDAESAYTVLATGMVADLQPSVFEDDPGSVPSEKAHVRFIHASPDAPAVSIAVRDGPELFSDVGFRSASGYEQVDADTYDLDVMPAGSDEVALALDDTTFEGGAAYTAIAVGRTADDSLRALLIEDATMPVPADD